LDNSELFWIWSSGLTKREKEQAIFNKFIASIAGSEANEDGLKKQTEAFCYRLSRKWTVCKRNLNHFKRKYSTWLASHTEVCISRRKSTGRPKLSYLLAGARAQRRAASNLVKSTAGNIKLLINSASAAARKGGKSDLANILKLLAICPEKAKSMRTLISQLVAKLEKIPVNDALALLLDQNLTKQQYISIRDQTKNNLFPSYYEVANKKIECRPNGSVVSDTKAEVPLQSLLNHTAGRILSLQKKVVSKILLACNPWGLRDCTFPLFGVRQSERSSIGLGYSTCLDMATIFLIAMG